MARGSVKRKANGWSFRVDIGPDSTTGRRRQVLRQGFRTKREAELALDEVLDSVRRGSVAASSILTLGNFLDEWLETQATRLRPTSMQSYRNAVRRVSQYLGKTKLAALTPLQIEAFYADVAEAGGRDGRPLKAKTIRNYHVVLRKALADAERLGVVGRNAASVAKPPTAVRLEHATWSSEDLRDFFAAIEGERLYAAYALLATTGMRRGEVAGLRWADLDFDTSQLAVVQTLTTVGVEMIFSPPKTTRSRRVVYLDPATLDVLRGHRR